MDENYYNQEEEQNRSSSIDINDIKNQIDRFREKINSKDNIKGNLNSNVGERLNPGVGERMTPNVGERLNPSVGMNSGNTLGTGVNAGTAGASAGSGLGTATEGVTAGTGASTAAAGTTVGASAGSGLGVATEGAVAGASTAAAGTATSVASSAGGAAAAGASTAAAGTATSVASSAGGGAAAFSALGVVLIIILIILLVIIVCTVFFTVIDTMSTNYGVDEDELVNNQEYNQMSLEELNQVLENSSDSESLKFIYTKIEEAEEKYKITLSRGLILATILYAYQSQPQSDIASSNNVDLISPNAIVDDIFNNGILTQDDIDNLINQMVFIEDYEYYDWLIDSSEIKTIDGIDYTYNYWKCKKVLADDSSMYYFDFKKFFIYLRYGSEVSNAYQDFQNRLTATNETPSWCLSSSSVPILEESSGTVINELASNYNSESLNFYSDSNINYKNLNNFFQFANVENTTEKDEFEPVFINGIEKKLEYGEGFIYQRFPGYKKAVENNEYEYNDISTPKGIEKTINEIDEYEDTANSILGYNTYAYDFSQVFGNDLILNALQYKDLWDINNWSEATDHAITGFNSSDAWCARFVSYIVSLTPTASAKIHFSSGGVAGWITHFASTEGLYLFHSAFSLTQFPGVYGWSNGEQIINYTSTAYYPKTGDLIFWDYRSGSSNRRGFWNGNPFNPDGQEHINMVIKVEGDIITTIGGNESDTIRIQTTDVNNHSILGYGVWDY